MIQPAYHTFMKRFQSNLLLSGTVAFVLSLALISLIGLMIDTRLFNGVNTWMKPLKFQLSVSIYLLTIAWFISYLPPKFQQSTTWFLRAACLATLYEIIYITIQGSLNQASHFNTSTPIYALLYGLMAMGAITLNMLAAYVGILFLRPHTAHRLSKSLRLAIGWGLILSATLGAITGFAMSNNQGHLVGSVDHDANGLWLLGWSHEYGDLRISHFLSLHAMHILPLLVLMLQPLGQTAARLLTPMLIIAFTALTVYTYAVAQAGQTWVALFFM